MLFITQYDSGLLQYVSSVSHESDSLKVCALYCVGMRAGRSVATRGVLTSYGKNKSADALAFLDAVSSCLKKTKSCSHCSDSVSDQAFKAASS
jgi:hypothetical protein